MLYPLSYEGGDVIEIVMKTPTVTALTELDLDFQSLVRSPGC
jgi:hypothetical protein